MTLSSIRQTFLVHFSRKQLNICAHHFYSNTSNHLSFGILVVHISAFHNNIKNRLKDVLKKSKKGPKFRVFSDLSKIAIIQPFISIFLAHPLSDLLCYHESQKYEPQGSRSSDDLKYWFKNGEHIYQAVFLEKCILSSFF